MKDQKPKDKESLLLYWIQTLAGNNTRFTLNMLLTLIGGTLYSFNLWLSVIGLYIFGVVSPLLFIFCFYSMLRGLESDDDRLPIPKIFTNPQTNKLFMLLDMSIIIVLASLIYFNLLNYLLFRLLQTVILPSLVLVMIRVMYVNLADPKE